MPSSPAVVGLHWLIDEIGNGGVGVLCGAGLSTDSGIPDYRGPTSRPRRQVTLQEFASSEANRQRYWARSFIGFEHFDRAFPNDGHRSLARLQQCGYLGPIITQNVDGLQQDAGATDVIDLHGRISQVVCLDCAQITARADLQNRFRAANPDFLRSIEATIAPDGDADIDDTTGFQVVPCLNCGGRLKPNVVMFGETVARDVVDRCHEVVDDAEMLLVVGTSLQVQSGLRFVRRAHGNKPIAIINRGQTRGDAMADLRLDAGISESLTQIVAALS